MKRGEGTPDYRRPRVRSALYGPASAIPRIGTPFTHSGWSHRFSTPGDGAWARLACRYNPTPSAAGGPERTSRRALLLAKAEAGWGNWGRVVEFLGDAEWIHSPTGGEGLLLLGRAHGETAAPGRAYKVLAAYLGALPDKDGEHRIARVLLARMATRAGDWEGGALGP